ncbi:DUF2971 domain-containing protein [Anaeromyxobacter terrae]|uniref:DUF2971 domain-containing protein n=1 Tax=Anaeromyxobacter terrae TaxID=2925406 RepID=UPI001F577411|nr:DUF2971 domain-containing protein [Anaeromyxobacter sp. SG22]
MVPDPGQEFVYHYTRASTAIEYIFPRMRLRLGSPADTNDPIEGLTAVSAAGGRNSSDRMGALFAARDVVIGSRIACFSRDTPSSPGWQHHRMWAQYAEHHRGVCLCLDRRTLESNAEALESERRKVIGRNVEYVDAVDHSLDMDALLAEGAPSYVARYFRQHPRPRYFTKLTDWAGESEFRLLLTGGDNASQYEFVTLVGALRGVYVGARFSQGYRVCIEELCSRERIPARQIDYMADLGWTNYFTPDP